MYAWTVGLKTSFISDFANKVVKILKEPKHTKIMIRVMNLVAFSINKGMVDKSTSANECTW